MAELYGGNKDEFVTSLAALALYDGDAEITADNIKILLAASNNTVAPYWPALFAGLLKNGRIDSLVFSASGGGAAPAAVAGAPSSGDAGAAKKEEKKEEKPKEEEVDALDGGMDMFGGGGGGGSDY
mmetsp:Transcript_5532/g.4979  ORF Transcript_5532/g.4979 Transcript_5532/m.4979 type:complete len:126 (+) Transcript_5532:66-443(+)|eukprot:CAMPEP_0196765494 /NCGR_PEP_ID=MMETSP1095-20130614/9440_1 /TAXON_ID=96789 ORGANISM="Chromulina nebulosa, Strain UTEXLB2642" /NCGR_SAMPLE_ID=MMETSP1095 /ASSEMBLY_ACC=CAM_ASM_000446 /LENGTH=125 /DNA_ID=CAMNT_0042123629 /DNA_START=65 /DNA_END=442 /DNA_ORIENTATION=+